MRGTDYQGDIAIDDVSFTATVSRCNLSPSGAAPFDCNFETGFCRWIQSRRDRFDWTRHRGSTGSFLTGPSIDHTAGTSECGLIAFNLTRMVTLWTLCDSLKGLLVVLMVGTHAR